MVHFDMDYLCKTTQRIKNFKIEFDYLFSDKVEYYTWDSYKKRSAKIRFAKWVKHAHGNPPPGTFYGSFTVLLPDKSRETVRLYL